MLLAYIQIVLAGSTIISIVLGPVWSGFNPFHFSTTFLIVVNTLYLIFLFRYLICAMKELYAERPVVNELKL